MCTQAGAQLVLHALDELAERHTPNGLCFPASFLRRRRVDGVEVHAVAAAAVYP